MKWINEPKKSYLKKSDYLSEYNRECTKFCIIRLHNI